MSKFETYFDKRFLELEPEVIDIDSLLTDKMSLIIGDFYGIQKFIFDRLSTKNASKVLRAKSAYILIMTEYIAKYICHKLEIDEKYIISCNAGKFEIFAPLEHVDLDEIQDDIDQFFIKNFYALSGVTLCATDCIKEEFCDAKQYRNLREKISLVLEEKKFQKFSLSDKKPTLNYDDNIDNQSLCKICNIRKTASSGKNCEICDAFIELGWLLANDSKEQLINSKKVKIDFGDGFETKIKLTKKIKSYLYYINDKPADFENLAKESCHKDDSGIEALGILKADVDGMGKYLEESDVTQSFANFDLFSKSIDNFFSLYVPKIMKENYPHTYTVFAGGDDLFLVGAWDEIIDLAKKIQYDFKIFAKGKLTISFGIAIAKPSTPISYLAEHSEQLLEKAKEYKTTLGGKEVIKNAIHLFGETANWQNYTNVYNDLYPKLKEIKEQDMKTVLLYRLLEFCRMKKEINQDIKNALWRSKLNYMFHRNVSKTHQGLIEPLANSIENYPKETKMVLSEYIYKRREV